jgi:hypothetical protein
MAAPAAHHDAPAPPTRRELRQFAYVVGGAFVALAALAWWRGHPGRAGLLAALGGPLALAGLLAPARLGGVYRAWMGLARAMSRVTTPVLMAVIYFGVLLPTALLLRLRGRRPLTPPRPGATAWVERPPGARRGDLRRQF